MRDYRSELQHPAPDSLVGDVETAISKEILDISIAEREAQVEPDGMLDDNRRKSVTAVGDPHNPASLLASSLPGYPVILTRPGRGNIVAWFYISDVLLDEVGDGDIVGQRDGHGLALARLDRYGLAIEFLDGSG